MYKYRVAFLVNGKQLNAWFVSPVEYTDEPNNKNQFREMAKIAIRKYLREVRSLPQTGEAESLAIWPEILSSTGPIQPLDAFELTL
mgnify:FL=1